MTTCAEPPPPPPLALPPLLQRRTKKVGITGKYGTRYGASLRKIVKKIEISQHAKYTCSFCGKDSVKRKAAGIWSCGKCKKTQTGGAYMLACVFSGSFWHGAARGLGQKANRRTYAPLNGLKAEEAASWRRLVQRARRFRGHRRPVSSAVPISISCRRRVHPRTMRRLLSSETYCGGASAIAERPAGFHAGSTHPLTRAGGNRGDAVLRLPVLRHLPAGKRIPVDGAASASVACQTEQRLSFSRRRLPPPAREL